MEKLQKEFAADVVFLFVYTREAHPDDGPENRRAAGETGGWRMKNNEIKIDNHKNYTERAKAAKDLKAAGKQAWRVLCDGMDDAAWTAWGKLPNSAYLISPAGRIAGKWAWVSAEPIRAELKKQANLKPWTVADDTLLPLRDATAGEWIEYDDGLKLTIEAATKDSVSCLRGDQRETVAIGAFKQPEKNARPEERELRVGKLTLPCRLVREGERVLWISPWLPADGVACVVEARPGQPEKVLRTIKDAGLRKGESCLAPFDGDAKAKR